eukprot:PhF_6_TR37998/c0_g1_i1/m.56743
MKWIPLDLLHIREIETQTLEVCELHRTLYQQNKLAPDAAKTKALSVLQKSIQRRIETMEEFYRMHDLDPMAAKVEQLRVVLKRTLVEGTSTAAVANNNTAQNTSTSSTTPRAGQQANNTTSYTPIPSGKVTFRIRLTPAEFNELQIRREAYRKTLLSQGKK